MKPFEELTQEERNNVVCNNNYKMPIFYASLTSFIPPNGIIYNDEAYEITPEAYTDLFNGKLRYEAYALQMTASDAERLLSEKAENVLQHKFATQIDSVISNFNNSFHSLRDTFTRAAEDLKASKQLSDNMEEVSKKLTDTYEAFDVKSVQERLNQKLDELKPVRQEFNQVVKDLKTLFEK